MIIAATASTSGNPHVDLLVDALPAGTAAITIRRSYQGKVSVIRDANAAPTQGASSRAYQDYETPFDVGVSYSAYAVNASGAQLGVAQTDSPVTVTSALPWISNPLAPGVACAVTLIGDSLEMIEHTTPGDVGTVVESSLPVAVMGTTQEGTFPLAFRAVNQAESEAVREVLRTSNPFLLRVSPGYSDVDGLTYVAHSSYTVQKVYQERDWITLSGIAVAAPVSPVVAPLRTYGDLRDEGTNYGDLVTLYPTYLDALRG